MRFPALLTAAPILLLMSACGTPEPTFGDRLQSQGAEVARIGANWTKGEDMVARGEKLVRRGRNQVEEGRERIEEGQDLIQEGRALMARAEKNYNARTQTAGN